MLDPSDLPDARGVAPGELSPVVPEKATLRRVEFACVALLVALNLASWAPRLSGPIDFRWDGGIYYILGTSLAQGRGYRLLNEPGAIQAIQYPPLLPAIVAAHQVALGTSDPLVNGRWLRLSACVASTSYLIAAYALARRYLRPSLALAVGLVVVSNYATSWLSDLLFAEVLFALTSLVFLGMAGRGGWKAEAATAAVGSVAFLLRTAALSLLCAWVAEALFNRRWRLAATRALAASIPVVAWQAYVAGVQIGPEYRNPAYSYQRAPYQYYNVSYAENLRLVDPFSPEKGVASSRELATRSLSNLATTLEFWGEGLFKPGHSRDRRAWMATKGQAENSLRRRVASLIVWGLGGLVLASFVAFVVRRDWLIPLYVTGATVVISTTPWPGQSTRYVMPLTPLLALALFRLLNSFSERARRDWAGWRGHFGTALLVAACVGLPVKSAITSFRAHDHAAKDRRDSRGQRGPLTRDLLFYDGSWLPIDASLDWIRENASPGSVVATSASQWAYLRTGLKAVMPPMEVEPKAAQRLLDSVPVNYLVVDNLVEMYMFTKYSNPVVVAYPADWELVYSAPGGGSVVYRRVRKGG